MMNKLLYVLLVFFIIRCSDNGEAKNESTAGNQEPDETYSIENLKWIYEYRNNNKIKMGLYVSSVKNSKSITENIENLIKPYCDNFDFRDVSNQGGGMMERAQTRKF